MQGAHSSHAGCTTYSQVADVPVRAGADRCVPLLVRPGERHGKALVIGDSTLSTRVLRRRKVKACSGARPVPLVIACMEGAAAA